MASSKPIPCLNTECDKHSQQFNWYCPSHLKPCCDECISTSHSKCTGIKSLARVVEETTIQKSKESLEKDINSLINLLAEMVNNKSRNIKTIEQQCEDIKKSVVEPRNEIDQHLDNLEKKFCQDTDTIWDKEKLKATDFITEIEEKKKNLEEMKDHLHTVIAYKSKLQSFLGVHQIEQEVHQCQQYAEGLENDERTREVDIKLKQNDEIEMIVSKLGPLESLGEVIVVKKENNLNKEKQI
ncbi:unnamed protein product [Mytilus coruscus]|uniref:B box-type domain-containing protein n=1 Tax=Mytilus coruscus TaxID=42192 RepID=A0A6J8EC46_MYTCO|nr:unnamed protein product [Mytilus coruscus]